MSEKSDHVCKLLDALVAQLMEHVSSVQIFVTFPDDEQTMGTHAGDGDWYARQGIVREWMTKDDERIRSTIRRDDD